MFVPGKISARQLITYGLFFLCAYAAWARGGTYPSLQWPLLIGALLLCFSPFLLERDRRRPFLRRVLEDPTFWFGLGLMVVILCQWGNSNYWVVLKESGGAELDRTPSKWFPWSINRSEAGEMLVWFFPAWVGILFVRNLLHRKHVISLLYLFAANSAVLACLGLLQLAVGANKVLGVWEQPYEGFFASFGYANHAAAWFYLNAFLAGGLTHNAFIKKRPMLQVFVWIGISFLCIISAFMTLSRFGALISVVLLGVFLVIYLKYALLRSHGSGLLNVYIFSATVVLVGIVLFFCAGGGSLAKEMGGKALIGNNSVVSDDIGCRLQQVPAAWEMIKTYPVFGSGGWGCRWLVYIYIPVDQWNAWLRAGQANLHCDPLQFLAEFGLVGTCCMGLVIVVLVSSAASARRGVLSSWLAWGLGIVFLHSLIDLPFRCPAILLEWCLLLAALPKLAHGNSYSKPHSVGDEGLK